MQITSPIGRGLLFFVTYVLFLYIYSPGLFYDEINLHMDDLLDYSGKGRDCYLAGGRWALALYREVFGGTALRCSNLTAGLYLCGALLVQIHILHIQRWISALAYVGVYLSCAQFAEFSLYLVMADAVALSVFFASLAVYMVSRANRKNKLILCGGGDLSYLGHGDLPSLSSCVWFLVSLHCTGILHQKTDNRMAQANCWYRCSHRGTVPSSFLCTPCLLHY